MFITIRCGMAMSNDGRTGMEQCDGISGANGCRKGQAGLAGLPDSGLRQRLGCAGDLGSEFRLQAVRGSRLKAKLQTLPPIVTPEIRGLADGFIVFRVVSAQNSGQ